jgi:hypothetical protein
MRSVSSALALVLVVLAGCDDGGSAAECDRTAAFPSSDALASPIEPAAHEAGDDHDECAPEVEFGPPSGAVCPEGSTLTYESFAKPFMDKYCTSCHRSTLVGEARQGATDYHDFDTENGILAVADHVDWKAAAGPDATNELMPVGNGPVPTKAEREQLGEWLACALAAM